jgi:hypothetical protein
MEKDWKTAGIRRLVVTVTWKRFVGVGGSLSRLRSEVLAGKADDRDGWMLLGLTKVQ